jgi:hypothetical protein
VVGRTGQSGVEISSTRGASRVCRIRRLGSTVRGVTQQQAVMAELCLVLHEFADLRLVV